MTTAAPTTVAPLELTASLLSGDARMDTTHTEFVDQLNALLALPVEAQLEPYRAFLKHTEDHFAQEDRWMVATGFAPDNCHAGMHATILETMRAVEDHYLNQGDTEIINRLAEALAEWFVQHAATMDAGLALHMRSLGFDSETETLPEGTTVRPATMSGCGSVSCSS